MIGAKDVFGRWEWFMPNIRGLRYHDGLENIVEVETQTGHVIMYAIGTWRRLVMLYEPLLRLL